MDMETLNAAIYADTWDLVSAMTNAAIIIVVILVAGVLLRWGKGQR
jgi:hypothetical protein